MALASYVLPHNILKTPTEIKIGYTITKMETFIPNPLRCPKDLGATEKNAPDLQHLRCEESRTDLMDCEQPQNCINCE